MKNIDQIPAEINRLGTSIASDHFNFIVGLNGIVSSAILSGDSKSLHVRVKDSAQALLNAHIQSQSINVKTGAYSLLALSGTTLDANAEIEIFNGNLTQVVDTIHAQAQRLTVDTLHAVNRIQIRANLLRRLKPSDALRLAYNNETLHTPLLGTKITDRSGRTRSYEIYVRDLVKMSYLSALNDVHATRLINAGEGGAKIHQPGGKNHGEILSLLVTHKENYFAVKHRIFHPNSNALLVPIS